jgi:prepilin-type N-terminal cleavage/methylation domain-containing protein
MSTPDRATRGFTLMELAVTVTLGAVVIALVGSLFVASLSTWRRGQDLREAQVQATTLADVMARDVRNASQAPSVTARPPVEIDDGVALLAIASGPPTSEANPHWILYVHYPGRGVVVRQIVTTGDGGRAVPRESRVVAAGIVRVAVEQVAAGVTIEVEARRGRASATTRAASAPRNP